MAMALFRYELKPSYLHSSTQLSLQCLTFEHRTPADQEPMPQVALGWIPSMLYFNITRSKFGSNVRSLSGRL